MGLKVLKFGGTSVGSAEALLRVASIVRSEIPDGGLVVVSALCGTTDRILHALRLAADGDLPEAKSTIHPLRIHHESVARDLGLLPGIEATWTPLFGRLWGLLEGVGALCEARPRTRDAALAIGESLSARLAEAALRASGLKASFAEARDVIKTDGRHGRAAPRPGAIRTAAAAWKSRLQQGELLVTQGFIGTGPDGSTTTLGRGGSDTSASLFGEALEASEVQIWTDVDGVLSADPSLVANARRIPRMSIAEAQALSSFGAKVLHAGCLAPMARARIPLVVANTHRAEGPDAARTTITVDAPWREPGSVLSVAYKEDLAMIRLPPEEDLARTLQLESELREAGSTRFALLAGPEGTVLVVRPEGPRCDAILANLGEDGFSVERDWALVALVGEGLRATPDAALRLLAPFQLDRIGGVFSGASPISLAFLVPQERLLDLVPRLHHLWIEHFELCKESA
ncbi:MAG: aspartate kinase [Holophagaceae bacterium]|nr:aspartate kinase [Holophagaceae bacterium]